MVKCEKELPGNYFEQIETLRIRITELHEKSYFASRDRAKVNILEEEEEKPSSYFNKVERRHVKKKTIKNVECNGHIFSETSDILD